MRTPRWLISTDHKVIGLQYLVLSLLFLIIGGVLSILIRWELKDPQATFSPELYNRLFTMHGTIMIFFAAIPMLTGAFGNYVVPLQVGARDMAFPRLNALSFWIFFFAGVLNLSQFFLPKGAFAASWLAYPPLSASEAFSGTGAARAVWSASLILMGFSSILGAINVLVTVITMRTPGMGWGRVPVFTWALFLTSIIVILVIPFLSGALYLLTLDQLFGLGFFLPRQGGSALLWQHLF
ncbi:MAG: cbb3-type cytochrome c oxidase subunit I, partial [candidate division NC10 bacterium]